MQLTTTRFTITTRFSNQQWKHPACFLSYTKLKINILFSFSVCVRAYVYRIFIPFFGYKTTNIRAQSKSSDDGMQSLKWIIKGCLRRESIHSIQVKICQNELCWKMQQNCNDFQCDEIIADVVHLCNRIPYVLNRKRDKLNFFFPWI